MRTEVIKFNKKIYSAENIKKAINEYRNIFGGKCNFSLKENKEYFEVSVTCHEFPENFSCEFANFVLSF